MHLVQCRCGREWEKTVEGYMGGWWGLLVMRGPRIISCSVHHSAYFSVVILCHNILQRLQNYGCQISTQDKNTLTVPSFSSFAEIFHF